MKKINILKGINTTLMILTVLLYVTIYLGLIFQIVLGVYQVITALVMLFYWKSFSKEVKNKLLAYWVVVLLYGSSYIIGFLTLIDECWFVPYAIIPMLIALYFSLFIKDIKKRNE